MSSKRILSLFWLCAVLIYASHAQTHPLLSSGPMLGYAEMTETVIWVQTNVDATVQVRYWEKGKLETSRLSEPVPTSKALDNRTYRSPNNLPPSPEKRMLGKAQMEWLKNALKSSEATFKVIACSGQIINPMGYFEGFGLFPDEQRELFDFIRRERITGVLFLSGDRHFGELLKVQLEDCYPFYELTASPLTARPANGHPDEVNNAARVPGTWVRGQRHFGLIRVQGKRGERKLILSLCNTQGKPLFEYVITEQELRWDQ
jgi:phosphodiesterase/alkaline phosphatase D-like protein